MTNYKVTIDGHEMAIAAADAEAMDLVVRDGEYHLLAEGQTYKARLLSASGKQLTLLVNDVIHQVQIADEVDQVVGKLGMDKVAAPRFEDVKAPMPGLILDILVVPGQSFAAGDPLLILEAMKMENVIKADAEGTVKAVHLEKGATVEKNEVIIEMV